VPPIAWNMATVRSVLGPAAWVERIGVESASRADMGRFRITVWTDNPAAIPRARQLWLAEPLLYGDDDDDLLAPLDALVLEEVAFLEFNASVHLVRLEDTMPSIDWPTPDDGPGGGGGFGPGGGDPSSGGDGFGAGGGFSGPGRVSGGTSHGHADQLPVPSGSDGSSSQRRWPGGRERRVVLGHTTSMLPWPRLCGDVVEVNGDRSSVLAEERGADKGEGPRVPLTGQNIAARPLSGLKSAEGPPSGQKDKVEPGQKSVEGDEGSGSFLRPGAQLSWSGREISRAWSSPSLQMRDGGGLARGLGSWSEQEGGPASPPDSPGSGDSWATPSALSAGPRQRGGNLDLDMFLVFLSDEAPSVDVARSPPASPVVAQNLVPSPADCASFRVAATPSSSDLSMRLVSFHDRCRVRRASLLPRLAPKRPHQKCAPPTTLRRSSRVAGRFSSGASVSRKQKALML
jgi:hypothetical protein